MNVADVSPTIAAALIIGGAIMLGMLAMLMLIAKQLRPNYLDYRLKGQIEAATKVFEQRLNHFGEANQILILMDQLKDRPDLVQQLGDFSQQAVAAGLLVRLNGIVADIKVVQKELTDLERKNADPGWSDYSSNIAARKESVAALLDELQQLNQIAECFGIPTVRIVK